MVNSPAKSPGLSKTGPLVTLNPTPISLAIICASVVFPNPGGPCSKTWSKGSPRCFAACTKMAKFSTTAGCPAKSANDLGLKTLSNSCSGCSAFSR